MQVQDPGELGQQLLDVLSAARRRALLRTGKMPRNPAGEKRFQVGNHLLSSGIIRYSGNVLDPDSKTDTELFGLVGSGSVKNHFSDLDL